MTNECRCRVSRMKRAIHEDVVRRNYAYSGFSRPRRDFDTRRTTTVRPGARAKIARTASRKEISPRISRARSRYGGLNKNISPRESGANTRRAAQSEMFARVSALPIPPPPPHLLSRPPSLPFAVSHRNARSCIILGVRVWVPRGRRVSDRADEITSRILRNQEHS